MNQITDEYRTVARGAAWIDRSSRGRLRLSGRDAASFLHALVTNDVNTLPPGRGVYAAYLTPQGRMIADMTIHNDGQVLLMDVAPGRAAMLAERFDQLIFSEDVRVSDVSEAIAHLTVAGALAAAVVGRTCAEIPIASEVLEALPVLGHVKAGDAMVVRTDVVGLPAFDVFLPSSARDETALRLADAGAVRMSDALFESLRIEAARPSFGVDMTEETIPLEAGLLARAISTTKGCYVGQEVIIRILHRGQGRVAKRLVLLEFDARAMAPPAAGLSILDGDREVGRVTSAAISPSTGRAIALGYVARDLAEPGRSLRVRNDGSHDTATILTLAG